MFSGILFLGKSLVTFLRTTYGNTFLYEWNFCFSNRNIEIFIYANTVFMISKANFFYNIVLPFEDSYVIFKIWG